VPRAATIGLLLNPSLPTAESQLRDVQEAARAIGLQVHVLRASTDREIDAAFEDVAQQRISALAVAADPCFDTRRAKLVPLSARDAVPTMYHLHEYAATGGLVSYGVDISDLYCRLGFYVARILKGEKPADLPVLQPTKFELVINLKTAKALGLHVPQSIVIQADEVIE
jgi:putative ABC transport system substrate-binding protein